MEFNTVFSIALFIMIISFSGQSFGGSWTQVWGPVSYAIIGYDKNTDKTTLYAVKKSSKQSEQDIYKYEGQPDSWTKIGGPGKAFAADEYGNLYGISPDGSAVYMYAGSGQSWNKIGGPADTLFTNEIGVFAISPGTKDVYAFHPLNSKWQRIGGPGAMFVDTAVYTYGLSPDKSGVWQQYGTEGKWRKVGGPAASIASGYESLFALSPPKDAGSKGHVYYYQNESNSWKSLNSPACSMVVSNYTNRPYCLTDDGVYGLYDHFTQWKKIGGPAASLYAGGWFLCATNPTTHNLYCYKRDDAQ
ncbi:MAG: hypothetical protein AB2665_18670 [Candidatus Thiodiazotropha sp.]